MNRPALGDFLALEVLAIAELAWQEDALCRQVDSEMFFPERGGSTMAAKSVCAACLVRATCLDWALEHDERNGVWGGKSEKERRRMRRARRLEQVADVA